MTGSAASCDSDAIRRSLAEPNAFVELFDRHHDRICGFLRGRVEPAIADELAAQAFLEAFDRRASYDLAYADAGPWLFGIALNLLRRHKRSEERRWRAYARSVEPAGGEDPGLESIGGAAPHLAAALAELAPADRDVLLLLAWEELSYEEIARALSIPLGTVRSRLSRARRIVRERLTANEEPQWTSSA